MSTICDVEENWELEDDLVMRKPKEVEVVVNPHVDNELEIVKRSEREGIKLNPVKASMGPGGRRVAGTKKDQNKKSGTGGGSNAQKGPLSDFPVDIGNGEDALAEIMADPGKFTNMINGMNKGDDDIMSKVIQEVSTNPEARKAVEDMIGDKANIEKLRSAMLASGAKMPKRKQIIKMEKDRKNAARKSDVTTGVEKVDCLHLTAGRKFKLVRSLLGGQAVCIFHKDMIGSVAVYEIGDIKVAYLNDIKGSNKKAVALLRDFLPNGVFLGNELLFFNTNGKDLTEKSLMSYLMSLPKDTLAVSCKPFSVVQDDVL
jgi:hypothetical protein